MRVGLLQLRLLFVNFVAQGLRGRCVCPFTRVECALGFLQFLLQLVHFSCQRSLIIRHVSVCLRDGQLQLGDFVVLRLQKVFLLRLSGLELGFVLAFQLTTFGQVRLCQLLKFDFKFFLQVF